MIQTRSLSKSYTVQEVETPALHEVNMHIRKGEFVAILGPSGSGKTTLLNILGLMEKPGEGSYQFLGQEVSDLNEKQRAALRKGSIGFIFQSFNLIEELNVYENISMPLEYLKMEKQNRRRKAEEVMEKMNISHLRQKFPPKLRGGQQQRVAIARAVAASPALILADEPTGRLNSKEGGEIMQLLSRLNQEGTTIVMVTHSPHEANYAHRIINLFDGRIITENIKDSFYV